MIVLFLKQFSFANTQFTKLFKDINNNSNEPPNQFSCLWPSHGKAGDKNVTQKKQKWLFFSAKLFRTSIVWFPQLQISSYAQDPYQLHKNQAPREGHKTVGSIYLNACSKIRWHLDVKDVFWEMHHEFKSIQILFLTLDNTCKENMQIITRVFSEAGGLIATHNLIKCVHSHCGCVQCMDNVRWQEE